MTNEKSNDFAYVQNQLHMARNEINNLRQQVTRLKHEHKKMLNEISNKLFNQCDNCKCGTMQTQSSASSSRETPMNPEFRYIGTIHTEFPSKRGIPRQPNLCTEAVGKLVLNNDVFTNPHHALEGLEKFSHMWILFHFHQTEATHLMAKIAPPRLNGRKVGVFGTRSPHRPSPIGMSLVKINEISGSTITFNGVDMMDGTPVLDIKPFIPHYDVPNSIAYGYSSSERNMWSNSNNATGSSEEENTTETNEDTATAQNSESRTLVGQESERHAAAGASNTVDRRNSSINDNTNLRMVEREAPDGEEEESVAATNVTSRRNMTSYQPNNEIFVPEWVDNPVVPTLAVQFKMPANVQLRQFGSQKEEKKKMIVNILSQDPRSLYLREHQGDSEFVFRIGDIYVVCVFNDAARTVYVNRVVMVDQYGPDDRTTES